MSLRHTTSIFLFVVSWIFKLAGFAFLFLAVYFAQQVMNWYSGLSAIGRSNVSDIYQLVLLVAPALPAAAGFFALGVGAFIDVRIAISRNTQKIIELLKAPAKV